MAGGTFFQSDSQWSSTQLYDHAPQSIASIQTVTSSPIDRTPCSPAVGIFHEERPDRDRIAKPDRTLKHRWPFVCVDWQLAMFPIGAQVIAPGVAHKLPESPALMHRLGEREERLTRPKLCSDPRDLRKGTVMPAPPSTCFRWQPETHGVGQSVHLIVRQPRTQ